MAQYGTLGSLHVEGKHLKDTHGNTVVLHGVMDTPSPYFNNYRWGNSCTTANIQPCISYFDKLFTAITDTTQGAWCNLFRLHLDPCWTNDPNKQSDGKESGEADISRFSETRLQTLMKTLYFPIIRKAKAHGLYVIMRPPGVCPQNLQVGDYYQQYLMTVWDIVTKNDSILKNAGVVSIELANEPVNLTDANGQNTEWAMRDYFQPIVDMIRKNGFTGIIWVPGTGWQSNYRGYAKYPIKGYNIGYAVHDYVGWYGCSDNNANAASLMTSFRESVPVVDTNPIVITEVDWSPEKEGSGHYNEHGEWVPGNWGTWATGSTSTWGKAYKQLLDFYGNISMTLSGTGCYIDIDTYINSGTVTPAFESNPEACAKACFDWYREYAKVNEPRPDYSRQWTSDLGNGTFVNPLLNGDFPDPDVIRVDDTFYMATTTMFHFPGVTLLKSKDLVNWEYCANPLERIADSDAYNLLNGKNYYAKGQWAPSLRYKNGTFYINFIAFGDDGGDFMLTATNPEGPWSMRKLNGFYYDSGLLFDGDNTYIVAGNTQLSVTQLDNDFKAVKTESVISGPEGLEGSHFYHIGDYYYIYCTYWKDNSGVQTIYRATSPWGPYEEAPALLMEKQSIHQGGMVDTPTGEWWTILFKDSWPLGRLPYLEPVTWNNGWPVLGNAGIDVSAIGKGYKKPDVGTSYPRTYLPTNDTFTDGVLGMQWQWNHNPDASAWSLSDGWLRLNTTGKAQSLMQARNSLTQRIMGVNANNTAAAKMADLYGTIKVAVGNMADGDVCGIAVFQDPYAYIGVKQKDGKRYLCSYRSAYNDNGNDIAAVEMESDELNADTIYLRAIPNFGSRTAKFAYSYNNADWKEFGTELAMRYTLDIFVGQRYYIFNYATAQNGGYVDIDWFSTEPEFSEDKYFADGTLAVTSDYDFRIAELTATSTNVVMMPNSKIPFRIYSIAQSGRKSDVTALARYRSGNAFVAEFTGEAIESGEEGSTYINFAYTDRYGTIKTLRVDVTVTKEADGIESVTENNVEEGSPRYFSIDGREITAPKSGIMIVREGGKVKKIIIK